MANFDDAIGYVLFNENGGVDSGVENVPSDRGGATRFGITHEEATAHGIDIANLTHDQAVAIYRSDYWRFDLIRSQAVATKLLDMVVNLGVTGGIMTAQRAFGIHADGVLGPQTIGIINSNPPAHALQLLALAAADHYCDIVRADVMHRIEQGHTNSIRRGESNLDNLKGWVRRAIKLPLVALMIFVLSCSGETSTAQPVRPLLAQALTETVPRTTLTTLTLEVDVAQYARLVVSTPSDSSICTVLNGKCVVTFSMTPDQHDHSCIVVYPQGQDPARFAPTCWQMVNTEQSTPPSAAQKEFQAK